MSTELLASIQAATIAVGDSQLEDSKAQQQISQEQATQRQKQYDEGMDQLAKYEAAVEKQKAAEEKQKFWSTVAMVVGIVAVVLSFATGNFVLGAIFLATLVATQPGLGGKDKDGNQQSLMDVALNGMTKGFEDLGMSKEAAKWLSIGIIIVATVVLTMGAGALAGASIGSFAFLGVALGIANTNALVKGTQEALDAAHVPKTSVEYAIFMGAAQVAQAVLVMVAAHKVSGSLAARNAASEGATAVSGGANAAAEGSSSVAQRLRAFFSNYSAFTRSYATILKGANYTVFAGGALSNGLAGGYTISAGANQKDASDHQAALTGILGTQKMMSTNQNTVSDDFAQNMQAYAQIFKAMDVIGQGGDRAAEALIRG